MKKILFALALVLLICPVAVASETALTLIGEPSPVTLTATTLTLVPVTSSANSTVAWTLLRGSNQSTTFARRWYVTEPGNYTLLYSYNPLTYTITTDYGILAKSGVLERRLSIPNGIYVKTTFTTVYAPNTAVETVYFDSEK